MSRLIVVFMTDAEQSPAPLSPAGTARAADADREAVAEKLRIAAAEGRIDFEELDDRLGQAYSAKTYGQLRALVADLPDQHAALLPQDAVPEPETLVLKTRAPNIKQSGQWTVPRRITAETTSGIITIDFTQATCPHREVMVEAVTRSWVGPADPPRGLGRPGRAGQHQHRAHQQQGGRDRRPRRTDRHRDRAPGNRLCQDQAAPPQTMMARVTTPGADAADARSGRAGALPEASPWCGNDGDTDAGSRRFC